ncbi:cobalamin-binding protein [Heliobacterium gestii]|uniref:Cobalamin-binding protein n=1 Tax=Heliomicrobium gestii TaxID=2699 RepID=A0A845L518_HELGE|nr:cobalamin-dependent protein [Heliomicrobium gestii]MBM7865437.1 methanogenic corrinoid protein MtbC1 [Heliomicrobium gestii]MZP41692.1 cobalamin-binding protein [Heliomicrobium gestii]
MSDQYSQISAIFEDKLPQLSEAILVRQSVAPTELTEKFNDIGRLRALQDIRAQLSFLSEAVATKSPSLFTDYVSWVKVLLSGRGIPVTDLAKNLSFTKDVLREMLPADLNHIVSAYLDLSINGLDEMPVDPPTHFTPDAPLADLARQYLERLLQGERREATRLIMDAVHSGTAVRDIYIHVFQRCQYEIGRLWQMNRINVAQEHYCSAATQMIMAQLYPFVFSGPSKRRRLVATCVSGELHEIGIRMVSDFLEMDGWDTYYLGASTPAANVVQALRDNQAQVLALSATMTFHVRCVEELIRVVRATPDLATVKIMVGGYPFNVDNELWRRVSADAYAGDALEAIEVANRLVTGE